MTPDLKLREAARILGYTKKTLTRYIHKGKIMAHRGPGGHFTINAAEIERYRAERATCRQDECHA